MINIRKAQNLTQRMPNTLVEKHNYLNKNILNLKSCIIREYDMKDAGFTILNRLKLFDEKDIKRLSLLPKNLKNIEVGKMLKDNPQVSSTLMKEFISIRERFINLNQIADSDILSIKKDAILTINKLAHILNFDDYEFRLSGKYSSYLYLNEKEFYYSSWSNELTTKGFGAEVIKSHSDFLRDIKDIMSQYEKLSSEQMIRALKTYRSSYLSKKLQLSHYRELNLENKFRLNVKVAGLPAFMDEVGEEDRKNIDITYNYLHYIIPAIGLII